MRVEQRAIFKAPQTLAVVLCLVASLSACLPNNATQIDLTRQGTTNAIVAQETEMKVATGAYFRFHYSDFYSTRDPNVYSCAGDMKRYYKPFELSSSKPVAFSTDVNIDSQTIKPAFIKNISVDLTDANSQSSLNEAKACAYTPNPGVPPTSQCATFDAGWLGGTPTSLGGSLLLVGGIEGANSALEPGTGQAPTLSCGPLVPSSTITPVPGQRINFCSASAYTLGVDALPADAATDPVNPLVPGLTSASEAISSWAKLEFSDADLPRGLAGSAVAYEPSQKKALFFSGATVLPDATNYGEGSDSLDTWIFEIETQRWKHIKEPTPSAVFELTNHPDCTGSAACSTLLAMAKTPSARAAFGYVSAPGFAVNAMSTTGLATAANRDPTDRILIIGGDVGTDVNNAEYYSRDTFKFNPTFGPEWVDMVNFMPASEYVAQWIDNFPFQRMNSMDTTGQFLLTYNQDGNKVVGFGAAPLYNANAAKVSGNVILLGGFDTTLYETTNAASGGNRNLSQHTGGVGGEGNTGVNIALPTYPRNDGLSSSPQRGTAIYPMEWVGEDMGEAPDGAAAKDQVPEYGGVSVLQGFNKATNDVTMFGGMACRYYLVDTVGSTACPYASTAGRDTPTYQGRYFSLGAAPTLGALSGTATAVVAAGDGPHAAGMASARGEDANGNVVILAWGGNTMTGLTAPDAASGKDLIHYMVDNAGTPTWKSTTPAGVVPTMAVNAQMVYSHVTRKFYMYGGYQPTMNQNTNATWELTVTGDCTAFTCTFAWKKLAPSCSPDCGSGPSARRSHRMVEVNYNNTSPTTEPDCSNASAPCSFGIFMEGGTSDGVSVLGDRWMFDPTANGSKGHWQRVNAFPPRHFAAMTTFRYKSEYENKWVTRSLMFGGETGLGAPDQVSTGNTYVPPTLGDTMMFDFDSNQWLRPQLLGQGVYSRGADGTNDDRVDQFEFRQGYSATENDTNRANLAVLSPPPLSGATMITRTYPSGTLTTGGAVTPLKIPEAYLVGGRKVDGSYSDFSNVYKFCPGTTGDDYVNNNGQCDAYDSTSNTSSRAPKTTAVGRWMKKAPKTFGLALNPANVCTYLGATTYDSARDKLLSFGGLTPASGNCSDKVTEASVIMGEDTATPDIVIYEYTFPTKSISPNSAAGSGLVATANDAGLTNADRIALHGKWTAISDCNAGDATTSRPTGRYGHTLSFDARNGQIIVVGGYDVNGSPLTYQMPNTTASIPEVWVAKRDDINSCYTWRQITTFGNSVDLTSPQMPLTGLSHAAAVFVNSTGYNTGYYTTQDNLCTKAGPVQSADTPLNKLLAGGAYIDIDRSQLGPNENLLLTLNYIPLSKNQQRPDQTVLTSQEESYFRIHLIRSGVSKDQVQQTFQPRYIQFSDSVFYPKVISTLEVLAPAFGGFPQQSQIVLPISMDSTIDRIRIERYSGSAILIDASLFRMGYR